MNILAVDTATESCSVAVIGNGKLLAEITLKRPETHSRHLLEIIDTAIFRAGIPITRIDGMAVTRGPGSFTGLRIGISTVKGLAMSLMKPAVGISSLEALAYPFRWSSRLIVGVIDARKKEVYFARHRFQNGRMTAITRESVGSPEDAVRGISEPCIIVGNACELYRSRFLEILGPSAPVSFDGDVFIQGSVVGRLAEPLLLRGGSHPEDTLFPVYIRDSDAELRLGLKVNSPLVQNHRDPGKEGPMTGY